MLLRSFKLNQELFYSLGYPRTVGRNLNNSCSVFQKQSLHLSFSLHCYTEHTEFVANALSASRFVCWIAWHMHASTLMEECVRRCGTGQDTSWGLFYCIRLPANVNDPPLFPHLGAPSTWFISLLPLITVLHFFSLSLLRYLKALSLCSVLCACGKYKRSVLMLLLQACCLLGRQRQALPLAHLLTYWQHREWVLTLRSVAIASQHAALTVVILYLEGLSWACYL